MHTRSCFGFPKILYKNCDQDLGGYFFDFDQELPRPRIRPRSCTRSCAGSKVRSLVKTNIKYKGERQRINTNINDKGQRQKKKPLNNYKCYDKGINK